MTDGTTPTEFLLTGLSKSFGNKTLRNWRLWLTMSLQDDVHWLPDYPV